MNPLLRRLLTRGLFVFVAMAGLAWLMGYLFASFVEGVQPASTASTIWSMTKIGLFGFAMYAVLECASYMRESKKKPPTVLTA